MEHGFCTNCWWWKTFVLSFPTGRCYMLIEDDGKAPETNAWCYCSNYVNRKAKVAGMKNLDEFIDLQSKKK